MSRELGTIGALPAWHRTDTGEQLRTSADALITSGCDWLVALEPISCQGIVVPDKYAICRQDMAFTDPERFLGLAGGEYACIQNADAFSFADVLCGESGARITSAGFFNGGEVVYLTALLPDTLLVKGDPLHKYLVIFTYHNGAGSCKVLRTPVRISCRNTLILAQTLASQSIRIAHRKNARQQIEIAKEILEAEAQGWAGQIQELDRIAGKTVDGAFVGAYLKALFPDPPAIEGAPIRSRAAGKRERIAQLFYGEQAGAEHPAIKGTAYGLFNAVTQYLDWESPRRPSTNPVLATFAGTTADHRNRAYQLIVSMLAGFDPTTD